MVQEDINIKDREAWIEVSGKMEHIYKKRNGNPIPAEIAQRLLANKQFIKIHDDGYHYDRIIGGNVVTKIMFGNYTK